MSKLLEQGRLCHLWQLIMRSMATIHSIEGPNFDEDRSLRENWIKHAIPNFMNSDNGANRGVLILSQLFSLFDSYNVSGNEMLIEQVAPASTGREIPVIHLMSSVFSSTEGEAQLTVPHH